MGVSIKRVDRETAREAHSLAFPYDKWCGDDHDFWLAKRGSQTVGFLAVYVDERGLFLSRVAVVQAEQGSGLGRRLVRFALRYGKRCGYATAYTYTILRNYESMCMLLKCGFRFVVPPKAGQYMDKRGSSEGATGVHYFARQL